MVPTRLSKRKTSQVKPWREGLGARPCRGARQQRRLCRGVEVLEALDVAAAAGGAALAAERRIHGPLGGAVVEAQRRAGANHGVSDEAEEAGG